MRPPDSQTMTPKPLTWDKFEQEVAKNAQFTIIHGRVYELSQDFLRWHPGGVVAVTQVGTVHCTIYNPLSVLTTNSFNKIGRDGSAAFDAFHDPSTQEELAKFYVGDIDCEATEDNGK